MEVASFVGIALLASTFSVAASAKLADLPSAKDWLGQLSIPWSGAVLGLGVAWEMAVPLGLLISQALGAVLAICFLLLSIPVLMRARLAGVGCACFGRKADKVGLRQIVRNIALLAVSLALLGSPQLGDSMRGIALLVVPAMLAVMTGLHVARGSMG